MHFRSNRQRCIFYPEDDSKIRWDLLMTAVLISSCVITPYRIAFGPIVDDPTWTAVSYTIDSLFFIDMLVMFNSAFYDDEFHIVELRS